LRLRELLISAKLDLLDIDGSPNFSFSGPALILTVFYFE